MDNVGSVLQNVTLTSGLIDFSGFQEFQDLFGSEALVNTSYNLGVDLGTGFTLADIDESLYTITTVDGKTVITFTGSGAYDTAWDSCLGAGNAPPPAPEHWRTSRRWPCTTFAPRPCRRASAP